ncbi:thioredoxin domain-containing protein [Chelonobacter oris]|uniref:hypothetical protein n=1 Tax=Chelonobacter oris TaxID=505317 RepID=UPI0006925929|nr:hypothetical protein [Chelonobacter oris]
MKTQKSWLLLVSAFFSFYTSQVTAQAGTVEQAENQRIQPTYALPTEATAADADNGETESRITSGNGEFAFEDGKDYFSYTIPIKSNPIDNRIEIKLFFTYECAYCLTAFDNLSLYQRLHDEQIRLILQPIAADEALFGPNVYYSLLNLDRAGLAELLLFDSAEQQGKASLVEGENLYHWLISHNVALDQFLMQLKSQAIAAKAKEAVDLTEKYGVFTSPFVVIDGQYVLTSSTLYNDDYTFAVMDFLISRILQQKQPKNHFIVGTDGNPNNQNNEGMR